MAIISTNDLLSSINIKLGENYTTFEDTVVTIKPGTMKAMKHLLWEEVDVEHIDERLEWIEQAATDTPSSAKSTARERLPVHVALNAYQEKVLSKLKETKGGREFLEKCKHKSFVDMVPDQAMQHTTAALMAMYALDWWKYVMEHTVKKEKMGTPEAGNKEERQPDDEYNFSVVKFIYFALVELMHPELRKTWMVMLHDRKEAVFHSEGPTAKDVTPTREELMGVLKQELGEEEFVPG